MHVPVETASPLLRLDSPLLRRPRRQGIWMRSGGLSQLSARDGEILALARTKLGTTTLDFDEVLRALREAVEARIPAGRIFLLASDALGPVVGSIVSGVGIAPCTDGANGALIVRIAPDGGRTVLGELTS